MESFGKPHKKREPAAQKDPYEPYIRIGEKMIRESEVPAYLASLEKEKQGKEEPVNTGRRRFLRSAATLSVAALPMYHVLQSK